MRDKGSSIKYVTLFLANFDPLPCHTLSHIPGPPNTSHISDPPPIFSRPSTRYKDKKPVQLLSQLFAWVFPVLSRSFVTGSFCLGGFVRGGFCPFPLLSEYICYNRKLNSTLNFRFHMYEKEMYV